MTLYGKLQQSKEAAAGIMHANANNKATLDTRHGEALKATAHKRLKMIYAVMRDRVPYTA